LKAVKSVIGAGGAAKLPSKDEFVDRSKRELAGAFSRFTFIGSSETTIADAPAVKMLYTYDGDSGRMKEACITRSGTIARFQFICEAPEKNYDAFVKVFEAILHSFRLSG
jgi:hypothetical protein